MRTNKSVKLDRPYHYQFSLRLAISCCCAVLSVFLSVACDPACLLSAPPCRIPVIASTRTLMQFTSIKIKIQLFTSIKIKIQFFFSLFLGEIWPYWKMDTGKHNLHEILLLF